VNGGPRVADVDLDRLADYVGGALRDTSAEDEVRGLVADDPAWREAFTRLSGLDEVVRENLRALGREGQAGHDVTVSMPEEVTERLGAALARLRAVDAPGTATPTGAVRRPVSPRPGSRRPAGRRATRFRSRLTVVGAVVAGLAAVVIGIAVAVPVLGPDRSDQRATTDRFAGANGTPMGSPGEARIASAPVMLNTGTDYTAETLASAAAAGAAMAPKKGLRTLDEKPADQAADGGLEERYGAAAPDGLGRLRTPEALAACLTTVVSRHGGEPVLVDYARYNGEPAVIVVLSLPGTAVNDPLVVALGPECGTDGDSHERSAAHG